MENRSGFAIRVQPIGEVPRIFMYGHSIAPTTLEFKEKAPIDSLALMREPESVKRSAF